jgi:hypothetical protein
MMKKLFALALVLFLFIVGNVALFAQHSINKTELNREINKPREKRLIERSKNLEYFNKFNKRYERSKTLVKAGTKRVVETKDIANEDIVRKSVANFLAPDYFIGEFQSKSISYFSGGYYYGVTTITADATEQNKIWIENLVPGFSNQKIYATISGDDLSISIPQGQVVLKEDTYEAQLKVYESSQSIKGKIDKETGVITISTNQWGLYSDGWLDLFSGVVTFTRLDKLPPVASYSQPQGSLFMGMDPDNWDSYNLSCIIGTPYYRLIWRNNYPEENTSYSWSYTDEVTGYSFKSTDDSLWMDVVENFYTTPVLVAQNEKSISSSFTLGADYMLKGMPSLNIAGGNATWLGIEESIDYGCANQDNGFTLLLSEWGAFYFGTGASAFSEKDYESLLVYYEKPTSTLNFEGVNVYLYVLEAPENTLFTMKVIKSAEDEEGFMAKGEVIATSTLRAKDAIPIIVSGDIIGYTLKFIDFKTLEDDGIEISNEYLDLDNDFFLELSGFNVPGVTMAVSSEEINPVNVDQCRSFFSYKDDASIYNWIDNRQTMFFNLAGAVFSYITFSDDYLYVSRNGGRYELEVVPYFDTISIINQSFPEWLSVEIIDQDFSDLNWNAVVEVNAEPLAENADPRYFTLYFKTRGAIDSVIVNQGGPVSVDKPIESESLYAFKNANGMAVKYPLKYTEMIIYSVSGAVIEKIQLPANGFYQLPRTISNSSINLIKFKSNKESKVIKVPW